MLYDLVTASQEVVKRLMLFPGEKMFNQVNIFRNHTSKLVQKPGIFYGTRIVL